MKLYIAPHRIPTILVTAQAMKDGGLVMEALSAGALDYLQKPQSGKWEEARLELNEKLETALKAKYATPILKSAQIIRPEMAPVDTSRFIILIGSSTGGTQALQEIFTRLPKDIPPILVTQHIPAGFSKSLADRLNSMCPFEVKEAEDGDQIRPGRILIAPGDRHMKWEAKSDRVRILDEAPVNRFRPSVDAMFGSFVGYRNKKILTLMLTGMGKDGAQSMLSLKQAGAVGIAQNEATSVVFGMPKEAIRLGAADYIVPLDEVPKMLFQIMSLADKKSRAK